MPDPTTNYSWDLPDVSGDAGSWGTLLNTILNDIDDKLYTADGIADAALPVAGGTMTGNVKLLTVTETIASVTGTAGTKTIDLSAADYYYVSSVMGTNTVTFDFTNGPATGTGKYWVVELNDADGATLAFKWGGSARTIKWQDGSPPTFSSGKDVVVFFTRDGGTTIYAVLAISNPS